MSVLDEIITKIQADNVIVGCQGCEYDYFKSICYYEAIAPNEKLLNDLLLYSLGLLQCNRHINEIDKINLEDVVPQPLRSYCFDEGTDLTLYMKRQVLEIVLPHLMHGFVVQFTLNEMNDFGRCFFIVYGVDVKKSQVYGRIIRPGEKVVAYDIGFEEFTKLVRANIGQPNFNVMAFRLSPKFGKKKIYEYLYYAIDKTLNENKADDDIVYGIGIYDTIIACINNNEDVKMLANQKKLLEILKQRTLILKKCIAILIEQYEVVSSLEDDVLNIVNKMDELITLCKQRDVDYKQIHMKLSEIQYVETRLFQDVKWQLLRKEGNVDEYDSCE